MHHGTWAIITTHQVHSDGIRSHDSQNGHMNMWSCTFLYYMLLLFCVSALVVSRCVGLGFIEVHNFGENDIRLASSPRKLLPSAVALLRYHHFISAAVGL